ncbi:alpha/beta fold hydrolase [Planktothrix sp. FACHB-1355]|uniref:Alpha/beta fold hydrolase n=1 Tax=Aerosakkonema funiforme FACHB-1375 TaxID=2949571 RepID=A0A926ZJK4_9CYAN|nr:MULTISPECIES: alpha/beta fold hydrolase [Oscillatoriales]MBD2182976.1 alpha/beta fold hydrolase [Aerosakkonema funiforme FACHB-1375]MBD3562962.1 alpha/beta fold hydrolase [Planktothrix sp. FACHB-1355]
MTHPVFDRPEVLRVLFHPRRDDGIIPKGVYSVAVKVESGVRVRGRLYPAAPDAPAILYYHGNGEIAAEYYEIANLYNQLGITLLVMDYRGYGSSDGTPTASTLLTDAVKVFDAVDSIFDLYGLNPQRLYVMGRSLGSAPAIEIAHYAGKRLAGAIIESGIANGWALLKRLGVEVDEEADENNDGVGNALKIKNITIPTLIIHGQEDNLIPVSQGIVLHRFCAAPDKRLVLIPGAGHNDLMVVGAVQYFEAIQKFIFS